MIIDFRTNKITPTEIVIQDKVVDRVDCFKYLGVTLDQDLKWGQNVDNVIKKLNPRLYCLRKLRSFLVNQKILQIFYTSMLNSVISFGITSWGGNVAGKDKRRIDRIYMRSFFIFQKKNKSINYEIALYLLIFWDQKQLCCLSDGI